MPFTLAHPIAILPFLKNKKLYGSALFIGSMVPDFEFYFQLKEGGYCGHSFVGIFIFDLPCTLLMFFLFHKFIFDFFLSISPSEIYNRLVLLKPNEENFANSLNILNLILSCLIGNISHIFLDAFTHKNGFAIQQIQFLNQTIHINNFKIAIYDLNQIIISVVGLFIIVLYFLKLSKVVFEKSNKISNSNVILLITITAIILSFRLYFYSQYNSFWGVVIAIIGSFLYSIIINAVYFKLTKNYENYSRK